MARPKGVSTGKDRLVEAAGRRFRVAGYGGAGVDALTKEAGLTSGAFYAHFESKAEAFRAALLDGLDFLAAGVARHREDYGDGWLDPFVDFYLGDRLHTDLSEACALPTLSSDAARADEETRRAYEGKLAAIAGAIADGLGGAGAEVRAWRLLAMLSGAAGMARACASPQQRARIVDAVRVAAKAI